MLQGSPLRSKRKRPLATHQNQEQQAGSGNIPVRNWLQRKRAADEAKPSR